MILKIENLSYSYDNSRRILTNINISLKEGEKAAIIGSNGAGKSTLLFNILGVLTPSSGQIFVDGLELNSKNLLQIRKIAGLVWQNPDDQLFMNKVYDDLAFGLRNYGTDEKQVQKIVEHVLEKLGISSLKSRSPQRLSFGEKRKVAIGTILAMEPKIMLLDEPSSFLDPSSRRHLIEQLSSLPQAMIVATHDLDLASKIADRVIILKNGSIAVDGKADEILTNIQLMTNCGL